MKLFLLAAFVMSSQAFASNCFKEVNDAFVEAHPKHVLHSIKQDGMLKPKEDRPYRMGEIWNNTNDRLDIYVIESGFMASFTHVALVENKTCKVENLIEVAFK